MIFTTMPRMQTPIPTTARLSVLAHDIGARLVGEDREITGIALDSRTVQPGQLFVAIPGATVDGSRFIAEAVRSGAAGVCTVQPVDDTPTIVAESPRRALAELSAAFYNHPARELDLLGITGSLGKTSTALLAEAAIGGAGIRTGVIGSLGIRFRGRVVQTGMTTPEAPAIHGALRRMVAHGVDVAVMEVTSHSLLLDRVRGIELAAGVLTNIVADEHLEFHPTPEHYVRTKTQFFDMLRPGAPLVVNVDNATACAVTRSLDRPVLDVTWDAQREAAASILLRRIDATGSAFELRILRPLPTLHGEPAPAGSLTLALPLLGRQQVGNAALAAVLSIVAGANPDGVAAGLARVAPIRRRMQVVHRASPIVIDDTVGNAESIRSVFETARAIYHRRLRVVYAIRGSRGATINDRNAMALAADVADTRAELVVTSSDDAAGPRDRVTDEERTAALRALDRSGVSFEHVPRLRDALARVLSGTCDGDLVLLLGAQGMDRGAALVREMLEGGVNSEQSDY